MGVTMDLCNDSTAFDWHNANVPTIDYCMLRLMDISKLRHESSSENTAEFTMMETKLPL